jgi:hypothetical protein
LSYARFCPPIPPPVTSSNGSADFALDESSHAPAGFGVEWIDDVPARVAIDHFDFSGLDTVEDCAREFERRGGSLGEFIRLLVDRRERELRAEGMAAVIALLWNERRTYLALRQIASAANLSALAGKSAAQLARECGVSKQAFKQGEKRFAAELELGKTRTQRSEQGREQMRLRNFRHNKK